MPDPKIAVVSPTVGSPGGTDTVISASTWLIGDSAAGEAFRDVMTRRYGKPLQSMQVAENAGTGDGLVILDVPEGDRD